MDKTTAIVAPKFSRLFPDEHGNKPIDAYRLFLESLDSHSVEDISQELSLHLGTVKRWLITQKIPDSYFDDLNRIIGHKYPPKNTYRDKDQFYTTPKISQYCYNKLLKILGRLRIDPADYVFIEPSAGDGTFYKLLPPKKRIGIDIEPNGAFASQLLKINYLNYTPQKTGRYIVIGNPPFGLRGNLALRFINHSYCFADVVAFILPPLFNSTGKGVPMKRVVGYQLAHSEKLPLKSFCYPNGELVDVATLFQVWTKINTHYIKKTPARTCKTIAKVYSLSDGGTPASTRNKKMINRCDVYLPSTCFAGMKAYRTFAELPNQRGYGVVFYQHKKPLTEHFYQNINWDKVGFLSTNSAKNLRTDLIENEIIKLGYTDE